MKIGHTIDTNGFLTSDILEGNGLTPDVTVLCPNGFYKPKWIGTAWVEGLTPTEINTVKNAPKKPMSEERIAAVEAALLSLMGL